MSRRGPSHPERSSLRAGWLVFLTLPVLVACESQETPYPFEEMEAAQHQDAVQTPAPLPSPTPLALD